MNELREISEIMIVNETYKLICSSQTRSCLKEDIKYITTSKESFEKQCIQQRDETNKLNVQLNTETEIGMKQKMASKESQDNITRADELRELLEAKAGEKKSTISCVNKDIPTIKTSKEDFYKQLLEKINETSELSVRLKTEIESGNKIKRLSKENQDDITKLKESGSMPKVVEEENERMISCWKKDIKEIDNQVEKISCYYNTNIRVNSRDNIRDYYSKNINGEKDDVNDKVTINNVILNTKDEGDNNVVYNIESGQTYTVTRDYEDAVNNNSTEVGFPNSSDGRKIITEDDRESDEEIEKYVVDNNVVGNQRGTKNNSKITSTTNSICTHKIQIDIIKNKINKRKGIEETIISNGNVWKKDGKRTTCERKNNKGYHEEKDSRDSSNKSCGMLQTKIDTLPQKKITPSDAPT